MLTDKIVMITGASGGIGRSMIEIFAKNNANIIACSRHQSEEFFSYCKYISDEYHIQIFNSIFDLTNLADFKSEILSTISKTGSPNVLINNAGILVEKLFHMTSLEILKKTFDVNFFSTYFISQIISRIMIKNNISGSIINISSIAAHDAISGQSAYSASKGAIESFSKTIAKELGIYNIRCNCIAPGLTTTHLIDSMSKPVIENYKKNTYLCKLASPIDIANTAVFLASEKSTNITGQIFRVDGGMN